VLLPCWFSHRFLCYALECTFLSYFESKELVLCERKKSHHNFIYLHMFGVFSVYFVCSKSDADAKLRRLLLEVKKSSQIFLADLNQSTRGVSTPELLSRLTPAIFSVGK